MASKRSSFFSKPRSHIFPTTSESGTKSSEDIEFDEADMWNNMSYESEPKKALKSVLKRGCTKKVEPCVDDKSVIIASSSLPMKVPDWSKILKEDYKKRDNGIIDEDFSDGSLRVPPHEYLARTIGASHSVHEGRGRTLKGRDLSRVRNAILKKVGFED